MQKNTFKIKFLAKCSKLKTWNLDTEQPLFDTCVCVCVFLKYTVIYLFIYYFLLDFKF